MEATPDNTLTRGGTRPLRETETWVFDLDNTLYPTTCRLFDQVDKNITRFIMQFLGLEWDD
ncbi:MAG: pyrimidine 5'-nucleotidase, partial [Alphaproteobacteria bacterium]|nr:pyrimidine 5'-nucleotidase [Alphaproteobacteria bacterium]